MTRRSRPAHPGALAVAALAAVLALTATSCSSTSTTSPSGRGSTAAPGSTTAGSASGGTATSSGTTPASAATYAVFNGQGNNLDAYEPNPPFTTQRIIKTIATDPNGLDINAQICFFPDGSNRFIAGEDTGQTQGDLQGWGIFALKGTTVGTFSATETAKLVPTYQGSADNAENYGCGFLKDGRVVTSDVGNQALGPGDGQLIVWFPPFDSEKVKYCKIDTHIATAQSILVDKQDNVYLASARPGTDPGDTGSGVWKYSGPWPTSNDASGGCGQKDGTGAPMADKVDKQLFIKSGENNVLSPAGLAWTPTGGIYLSSVANGVINEYTKDGAFVRTILQPPAGETLGEKSLSTGTPLGIGVGPDGTLFYADIGVINDPKNGMGPGDNNGSLRRITFKDGKPQPPETMATGLAFPDGIGIFIPPKP